jgi:predicted Zn-dependent protease
MRAIICAFLWVLAFVAGGCAINPVTGQQELRLVTKDQEVEMGTRIDTQVRTQYKVVTGTAEAARVAEIGARIAAVSDRRDIEYHYALIDSSELNAFAAPGGFVYVTTELLRACDSDAELAAVIGHETGHVAAYHSVHQVQRALGYDILKALFAGDANSSQAVQAADVAFNSVVMTGFSREDEYQADELGVKYSAKAGYDPYGLANFFVKLQQRESAGAADRAFEFLLSHPNTPERRRRAEAEAAKYGGGRG